MNNDKQGDKKNNASDPAKGEGKAKGEQQQSQKAAPPKKDQQKPDARN